MAERQRELRPFHETIVDAIKRTKSINELYNLGELIKETKIPKNHDEIASVWVEKEHSFGYASHGIGVDNDILNQKKLIVDEQSKATAT